MRHGETLRNYFFPYGMRKQTDGTWVLFNRRYKPVGMRTLDYVNYDDYPVSFKLAREDKRMLAKLSHTGAYLHQVRKRWICTSKKCGL